MPDLGKPVTTLYKDEWKGRCTTRELAVIKSLSIPQGVIDSVLSLDLSYPERDPGDYGIIFDGLGRFEDQSLDEENLVCVPFILLGSYRGLCLETLLMVETALNNLAKEKGWTTYLGCKFSFMVGYLYKGIGPILFFEKP